jgi:cytochrome P450
MTAPVIPVLRMVPQRDGRPHPELLPAGRARQVRAEAGGEPLTVLRTRRAVLDCVTSPDWVMAGITEDGQLRNCPVTGAEQQSPDGGLLNMDPPAHRAFRGPVNRIFTRAAAREARADTEQDAAELALALRGRRAADLAADYADPLAGAVICRSLGTDDWGSVLAGADNAFSPVHGQDAIAAADAGWKDTYEFYGHTVTRGLARPGGTIAQIAQALGGFPLSQVTHVLGNVGNGYPAVRQSARRLLREAAGDYRAYTGACQRGRMAWSALTGVILNTRAMYPLDLPRRCAAPDGTWLDGRFFAPGELVLPSLAAAAADPSWPPPGDIAFSYGRHRCPGRWLARMWLEVAAEVFFTIHPHARLSGDEGPWEGDALAAPRWITVTGLS